MKAAVTTSHPYRYVMVELFAARVESAMSVSTGHRKDDLRRTLEAWSERWGDLTALEARDLLEMEARHVRAKKSSSRLGHVKSPDAATGALLLTY